jgi:hypothetical protein
MNMHRDSPWSSTRKTRESTGLTDVSFLAVPIRSRGPEQVLRPTVDRLAMQDSFSYAYTPQITMAGVTDAPHWGNGRTTSLSYRMLSSMQGSLGIGVNLNRWSAEDFSTAKRLIAAYHLVQRTIVRGDRDSSPELSGLLAGILISSAVCEFADLRLNRVVNAPKTWRTFGNKLLCWEQSTSRREICIRDTWLLLPPIRV